MIKTLIRFHHWTPEIIDGLYLDGADHFGIEWLYNDVVEYNREIKGRNKKDG